MATQLQIVNRVLVRLREGQVTATADTKYSTLINEFADEAREYVENAHNWSVLRTTQSFNTAAGTSTYGISGGDTRGKVLSVYNTTQDGRLLYAEPEWVRGEQILNDEVGDRDQPGYWTYSQVGPPWATAILLHPVPDSVYTMKARIVLPQENVTDTTEIAVDHHAVVLKTYALALAERGEDGGTSVSKADRAAEIAIADAIILDKNKFPEENVWRVV
jgi:hypothetical protein